MKIKNTVIQLLITLILLLGHSLVYAALPDTLNYQGHLTDSAGAPIDGAVNVTFKIYDVNAGGTALWTDSRAVTVNHGVFSIELGAVPSPLPNGIFEMPLWVGISVGADAEMMPRRPITTTGYAFKAGDANTLDGISASTLDQSVHAGDITTNPHKVTAGQVGALSGSELTTHAANASAHHSKTSSFPELTGQIADAQIPVLIARDTEITWNNLAGKPADFADDIDNDSGGDITGVTAGTALTGGGTSGSVALNHADTSSQSSVNNSNGSVIQDIILDSLGHLTGLVSANLDSRYYTRSLSDSRYVNVTGDTMTGNLNILANVGIGTASPTERLDVNGNLFMSGGDIKTDRWLYSSSNTGIGVGVFGAGNLSNTAFTNEGWYNTAIGFRTLYSNTTGILNTAIGYRALYSNTTGIRNIAVGEQALAGNTAGHNNIAVGTTALNSNTTGDENIAVGTKALYSNTTGGENIAVGWDTLSSNINGRINVAVGGGALDSNTSGSANTAVGYSALDLNTTGGWNTAISPFALGYNTTGKNNVAIGYGANIWNKEGSNNTIIGKGAGHGRSSHNKSGNVFLGYNAGYNETGSNKLYINNSSAKTPLIYGDFASNSVRFAGDFTTVGSVGIGTLSASPNSKLEVNNVGSTTYPLTLRTTNGYGHMGALNANYFHFYTDMPAFFFSRQVQCTGGCVTYSDISLKMDIEPVTAALDKIISLNGVTWNWKDEDLSRERQMGLIAQNVEEVAPELVEDTSNGKTMNYDGLSALTIEAIKELKAQIDELRAELKRR